MNRSDCVILFSYCLMIFQGCNNHEIPVENKSGGQFVPDSSEAFLKLFPEISKDTLHVYFSEYIDSTKEAFAGKQLNESFYRILMNFDSLSKYQLSYGYHFFSCYKIKLSKSKTGLIMRVPSQYSESAVDMYVWDNQAKKITGCQNLSDHFGDGGWYFDREAWITDVNHDGLPDIIQRQRDHEQDSEDSTDTGSEIDSTHLFIWNLSGFKKSNFPIDSSKFQLKHWD